MIGTVLDGRYKLERVIGAGGMGAVYEATHTVTGKRVAVKLIQQVALGDTDVWSRFQREARASSAIDTRHIVAVTDSGRDAATGLPFMAMELLRGEDLGSLLDRTGKLEPSVGVRLIAQACVGISKAHRAHVVHRDIKPANLFLTEDDEGDEVIVKLLDFGIAKVRPSTPIESDGLHLTQTGKLLGTPLYMSPEQAQGAKDIDARTDVWSIGAVLYETLTGQSPFQAADNLGKLILAICSKPPARPRELADIAEDLDSIVMRCLAIERADRYPSVDDLLSDLSPWLTEGSRVGRAEVWHGSGAPALRPSSRGVIASRPRRPSEPSALSTDETLSVEEPLVESFPHDAAAPLAAEDQSVASTLYASSQTHAPGRPKARGRLVLALAGAASLVGLGAAFVLRGDSSAGAVGAASSSAVASSPSAAVSEDPTVTFTLEVTPPDARVLIDGEAAKSSEGSVPISGELGDQKTVVVTKGEVSQTVVVVLTKLGPSPARVALGPPVASSAVASALPSTVAAKPSSPPTRPPSGKQIPPPPAPTAIPHAPTFE